MTTTEARLSPSTEASIEMMLLSLSVPPHLKGFRYLARAIALSLEDESCLQNIMVQLYGCIAEEFGVTAYSVERDARTALHQIPPELCREILGAPDRRKDKPITVRAFVALCMFRLKYPG
ncbi:MAG: sporulation initiation factor Spo0A C-terminal domain-containing protein [Clostridia bacterium]|nr:sporulation initiation factor Spo0A C-terminal domain-containing protein [Clostridia bacterium]